MELGDVRWRKSSLSGENGNGSGCVEVAFLAGDAVALRDSKDRALAPHRFTGAAWRGFLAGIRAGEFD